MPLLQRLHMTVTSLLYLQFVASGLSYILLAMHIPLLHSPLRAVINTLPLCEWATSVYVLCTAHILHSASVFGWRFAMQYTILGLTVVTAMEEFGLRSGVIFGEYYFTATLGSYLTNLLPTLVPFLWFALSYPIFLFTYLLMMRQKRKYQHVGVSVLLASSLLAGYDLISEPIGILYGNQLWHHAAHVDSETSMDTFVPQPDWVFGRPMNGDGNSQSMYYEKFPVLSSIIETLSFPCHYNIPLHNFLGWFLTALIMYACIFYCDPNLRPGFVRVKPSVPYKGKISSSTFSGAWYSDGHIIYLCVPVLGGLFCTQIFYLVHPCHPLLVRGCSLLYLSVISVLSFNSFGGTIHDHSKLSQHTT